MRLSQRALLVGSLFVVATLGCEGRLPGTGVSPGTGQGALTDGQVAEFLRTANLNEIARAGAARPRLTTAVTRNFADRMVTEAQASNAELQTLVENAGLAFEGSTLSTELLFDSERIVGQLDSVALPEVDQLYLETEISMDENVRLLIDDDLLPEVQNVELQTFVAEYRAVLTGHIDAAQLALDDLLGVPR